ncbi:hypothetical protein SteCoe_28027 [Stentor coeruleus]|uniref:C2H2-type domain-containing protein n=1 Tax=Stentor coeruleus TaxID=5963 RepID=A0A1R2B958_9CILI|nr:hypothetical protein SteCoe_28027 [Stentor coeruleus]
MLRTTINMDYRETRPFICEICQRCFKIKKFLKRHYNVHSEERKHKCEFCESNYKYRKGLNRHYKKYHYNYYEAVILSSITKYKKKETSEDIIKQESQDSIELAEVKIEYLSEQEFEEFNEGNMDDDYASMLLGNDSKIFQTSPYPQ